MSCYVILKSANLVFKIPPRMTKLLAGHEQVSSKPMHNAEERTVTLTFNLAAWFLFATHRLIMILICAKLFSNPTVHNKVMGRTRTDFTKFRCGL